MLHNIFFCRQEWAEVAKAPPVKPKKDLNEWQMVVGKPPKSPAVAQSKCYFRLSVDGVMTERIVFQLDYAAAPVMSSKFAEMCTSKTGYLKSRIFKASVAFTTFLTLVPWTKKTLCNGFLLRMSAMKP